MFALMLLGVFVLLAVVSLLGLTADSRDFRPGLPVQGPDKRHDAPSTEPIERTALPPAGHFRPRRAPGVPA